MADIQQAAKWMQEGKHVRRAGWYEGIVMRRDLGDVVIFYRQETALERAKVLPMLAEHLLADDWEIAN